MVFEKLLPEKNFRKSYLKIRKAFFQFKSENSLRMRCFDIDGVGCGEKGFCFTFFLMKQSTAQGRRISS